MDLWLYCLYKILSTKKDKIQTWPILTLSAAWNCSSVTKSRIISPFQWSLCFSPFLLSYYPVFFRALFLWKNLNFESQSCAILKKNRSLSPFAPLISLFHSFIKKEKSVCRERERVKKKMSERTVEVRSRLRSSRRDRRALFIQDNDRANRLMGNGLIFIIFQKNTFIHKIRR